MTTFEPGASDVFTHGLRRQAALRRALRASSPAPIITDGFEVFVQLVIAAITTCPWSSSNVWPSTVTPMAVPLCGSVAVPPCGSCGCETPSGRRVARLVGGRVGRRIGLGDRLVLRVGLVAVARHVVAQRLLEARLRRRSARRGPAGASARRGSARRSPGRARSSSEYVGSSALSSCQRPCSFAYASTSATCSSGGR